MSKRRAIEIPGLEHSNPIPTATRIGPFLVSGGIPGKDPETGRTPPDLESQCALVFTNIRRIMKAAGGSTDDIIKLTVWLKSDASKKPLNDQWLAMFPDPESRPARHTFVYDDLPFDYQIQCEIMAVLAPGGE